MPTKFNGKQCNGEHLAFYAAMNEFCNSMKRKFDECREKGRTGWDEEAVDSTEVLKKQLMDKLNEPDSSMKYVDVANFAVMLWNRM